VASYHGSISAATARSAAMVDGLLKAAGEGSLEALASFGAEMVAEIKSMVGQPGKSDNQGPVNPRSLPWDPAALQTGDYQASWDYKAGTDNGKPYVDVGSTSSYSGFLEYGTRNMDPRPALRPATDHMQQVLSGRVVEHVTKAQKEVASKFKDILSIMGGG